jgi:hypothetical protein
LNERYIIESAMSGGVFLKNRKTGAIPLHGIKQIVIKLIKTSGGESDPSEFPETLLPSKNNTQKLVDSDF